MASRQQPRNKRECTNRADFIRRLREEVQKAKIVVFYKAGQHHGILDTLGNFMSEYPNVNFLYLDVGNVRVQSVANHFKITEGKVPTVILYGYGGDGPVWVSGTDTAQLQSKVRAFLGPP